MSQTESSNIGSGYGYDIENEGTNDSQYQHVEIVSQITDADKERAVMKAYRNNEMIEEDRATMLLVKEKAKEVIWPYTKFGNIEVWSDIDTFDEGTVLHRMLQAMNLLHYGRLERVKFWQRYCKVVYDTLSVHKATASDGIRRDMQQGIVKTIRSYKLNNPQEWQNLTFKMCLMLIIYDRSQTSPNSIRNEFATDKSRRRSS